MECPLHDQTFRHIMIALLVGSAALACASAGFADDQREAPVKDDSDSVFGLMRVWKIQLHVSAENWKTMQPAAGEGFPGFGPPPGIFTECSSSTCVNNARDPRGDLTVSNHRSRRISVRGLPVAWSAPTARLAERPVFPVAAQSASAVGRWSVVVDRSTDPRPERLW